jgi:DNA-binding response OmpR family regulator
MKKKLIVVEDDPAIQDVLQLILEKAGYCVQLYSDGNKLLDELPDVPDVFLIDKQLSGVDGLDLCFHLKKQSATARVPIIIMSATPQIEVYAKNAGVEGFIEKPFTKKHLLKTIEEIILA